MKNLLATLNSKFTHSAISIRYLREFTRDKEYMPEIKEYTINEYIPDIIRDILKVDYDIICFSCYIWNIDMTLKIAEDIKRIYPNIIMILGGPEVSYGSDDIMKKHPFIDYIIEGEGELTYKELMEYLYYHNRDIRDIDGITYRLDKVYKNKKREYIKNLDIVPFPYETLEGLEHKKLYYESSRGCPYSCKYCLSSTTGRVRFFSLERVKKDLLFFIQRKVPQVKFVDRTFNTDRKRALDIFKFLHEHDNQITNFHFEIVGSLLDDETIEFLSTVRKGLFQFEIGVQSTNTDTISAISRHLDFKIIAEKTVKVASFNNIHLHLDLIAGLPYENYESFLNSFEEVYRLRPEQLQLGFLKLLKGSALRLEEDKYDYRYSSRAPYEIFSNKFISYKEITKLKYFEETLETYYNSNRFQNSIEMILKNYDKAYKFYLELSEYFLENDLYVSHKLIRLYEILIEFYQFKEFDYSDLFYEVVKHDYFIKNKKKTSHIFNEKDDKHFKNKCYDYLKPLVERPKERLREVNFVQFEYDILKYIESDYNEAISGEYTIFYDYAVEDILDRASFNYIDI